MNPEIQENMAILMGKNAGTPEKQLEKADKKQLSDAYFNLFFGLSGANWAQGEQNLGAAWFKALQQIKSMIGAKDKSNPAAMYLNQIFAAHNAKWSQIIMTNANKDKKLDCNPEQRHEWNSARAKQIGDAMRIINTQIERYKQKDKTNAHAAKDIEPHQMRQKILLYMAAQKHIKQIS